MVLVTTENFVKASEAIAKVVAKCDWSVSVEDESKEKQKKKPQDVEKIIADATKLKTKQRKKDQKVVKTDSDAADGGEAEDESDAEEKEEVRA